MRSFIYTYSESKAPRNGSGVKKTVSLYEIVNNEPRFVGQNTDRFVGEFQLVLDTLLQFKDQLELDVRVFERSPIHSCYVHKSSFSLEEAGLLKITRID